MLAHRTPRLSVVMPVHNAMPYLDAAVQSILGQTFADFEFVILDDASTDGSTERLRHWARQDARIRLIEERAQNVDHPILVGYDESHYLKCLIYEVRQG